MSAFKFLIFDNEQKRAYVDNQKQQTHTKRLSKAEMWIFQPNNMADEGKEKTATLEI